MKGHRKSAGKPRTTSCFLRPASVGESNTGQLPNRGIASTHQDAPLNRGCRARIASKNKLTPAPSKKLHRRLVCQGESDMMHQLLSGLHQQLPEVAPSSVIRRFKVRSLNPSSRASADRASAQSREAGRTLRPDNRWLRSVWSSVGLTANALSDPDGRASETASPAVGTAFTSSRPASQLR